MSAAKEAPQLLLLRQYAKEALGVTSLALLDDDEGNATTYWRIAKKAAKQGRADVIQQLLLLSESSSSECVLHALSASTAPILAAAAAGHANIVFLLLPLSLSILLPDDGSDKRGKRGGDPPLSFPPSSPAFLLFRNLLTNAAGSGNLSLLEDLFLFVCEKGGGGSKYDLLADAHASAAARGHVHVLEWLWGSDEEGDDKEAISSSPRCRFMPADYTKLILGDCPPTERNAADRIRVLEWAASVSATKGDLLAPTGEIVREAARGGSTTVFKWLLDRTVRRGHFPFIQMAVAAASHGHVGLLELILDVREDEAAMGALRAPGVIGGAVRYGHLGVVRWLFEEIGADKVAYSPTGPAWKRAGPGVYRNLPAIAFENGQVDILEFLYAEACVPYGGRPTHVHACAMKFFREHANDWAAGIFPGVNVKPAAAAARVATSTATEGAEA